MADYINRNEVLKWKETITTDDYSGNETMDVVAVEEILDIELADVVEREKYDELQSGYETLKHQLEKSWDRIDELDNMRDKIDKSIAEMREEYDNFTYSANKTLGASFGIRKAIEILEKNLGEEVKDE